MEPRRKRDPFKSDKGSRGLRAAQERTLRNLGKSPDEIFAQRMQLRFARKWQRLRNEIVVAATKLESSGLSGAAANMRVLLGELPLEMAGALERLSVEKVEDSFKIIADFLTYPDAIVREAAVRGLGNFGLNSIPLILPRQMDSNEKVRQTTAKLLGHLRKMGR